MKWLFCVAAALLLLRPAFAHTNVLLIVVDDLRPELGCYGSTLAKSPNIDKLAQRGVRFDRAYCQYPVCNPSRVSFLTGLRPDTTKILGNDLHFRKVLPEITTLPQLFRANGYFTASLGKIFHRGLTMEDLRPEMDDTNSWSVARYFQATPIGKRGEGRNLTDGKLPWCRWLSAEGTDEDQPDGQIANVAIDLLEKNRDKPFFLAVGFHKPHDPFIAPKKYFDLYPLDRLVLPTTPTNASPALPPALGGWTNHFQRFSEQDRREYLRAYLACVSFMDAQVGRVLDTLDRLGLQKNTLILFLGDHGFHLGERDWWNKSTLYELSARVPLIVAAPGAQANGLSSKRLVELVDLYPTVTEYCGLKPPHTLHGRSFLPLLQNPDAAWKEAALTQVQRGKFAGYSLRTERWRYTEWGNGGQGIELYDHSTDPHEWFNVATNATHAADIKNLAAQLRQLRGIP